MTLMNFAVSISDRKHLYKQHTLKVIGRSLPHKTVWQPWEKRNRLKRKDKIQYLTKIEVAFVF